MPFNVLHIRQRGSVRQPACQVIATVLAGKGIQLGIGFSAGKELEEGKEFPFVRNVEGFALLKVIKDYFEVKYE